MANKNEIDLRRFIRGVGRAKWLYAASLAVFMGAAFCYVVFSQPRYTIHSSMLIEDSSGDLGQKAGGMSLLMRSFSLGGFASSSVDNEILLVNTHDVAMRTVRDLGLNVVYAARDGLRKRLLFGESPVRVIAPPEYFDTLTAGCKIRIDIRPDGHADIKATKGRFFPSTLTEAKDIAFPCELKTPIGSFSISLTPDYVPGEEYSLDIGVCGYHEAAFDLYREVDVDISDKLADGIDFEYVTTNRDLGRATLNSMMAQYNSKRLERKRDNAMREIEFLDDRIASLFSEMTESEKAVERYKNENSFVSIQDEAPLLFESTIDTRKDLLESGTEILFYKQILDVLESGAKDALLPVSALPSEKSKANPMVEAYNTEVLKRRELARSALPGNPALEAADARIAEMRLSVIGNIDELLQAAQLAHNARTNAVGAVDSRLRSLPKVEREYLDLTRDKVLKNELYAFLMEKRESALLQLYSNSTLGFVTDEAYSEIKPSRKRPLLALSIGLILALLCPTVWVIAAMRRKNRVESPIDLHAMDLEDNSVSYTGEKSQLNRLRSLLTEHPGRRCIFAAAFSIDNPDRLLGDIGGSLASIGNRVSTEIPAGDDNDSLLLVPFRQTLAKEAAAYNYIIIPVPDPDHLGEIRPLLDSTDATLLLIIKRDTMNRNRLVRLLEEARPQYTAVLIVD